MKPLYAVLLLLLFVTGCSTGPMVTDGIEGGPGQDISVAIGGVEQSMVRLDREGTRLYKLQIEVSNNSNRPVTVTRIRVDPGTTGQAFAISPTRSEFNEMIDPGEDHLFDVRLEGRLVRPFRRDERNTVEFRVIVTLASGESYFYTFEGPVRE